MSEEKKQDVKAAEDLELNIVLAGVGGQGTLIAGKLLGVIALKLGLDVKVSEVHGMSQRGGSVITYVRIGKKVYSPLVEPGTADFCLAFEELEGLRWSKLLKKDGVLILSRQHIDPLPVLMGKATYPERIPELLEEADESQSQVISLDAMGLALRAGTAKAVNLVMLGALSAHANIPGSLWDEAIMEVFAKKPDTIPLNLQAFQFGRNEAL